MNTKKYVYDKLVAGLGESIEVFNQSDDENQNAFGDKFPLVTYYRLSELPSRTTQLDCIFQITPWALTGLETENVKNQIVSILNGIDPKIITSKIQIGRDILDPDSKAHGCPITFKFTIKD